MNIEDRIALHGPNIDVGYNIESQHEGQEMDIADAKVRDRWSRYIGAMGIDAVQRQAKAKVILFGISALGVEIAKNIILSGVKLLTLVDWKSATAENLSGQFFLTESDIGKNRAEASRFKLSELNYYVRVDIKQIPYPKTLSFSGLESLKILDNYDVIVLTETSYLQQRAFSEYCRARGKKIIIGDAYGAFGRVLTDFGKVFRVYDKDGEEPAIDFVGGIGEDGCVRLIDGKRHMFEDGESVVFDGVEGMERVENGEGVMEEGKAGG